MNDAAALRHRRGMAQTGWFASRWAARAEAPALTPEVAAGIAELEASPVGCPVCPLAGLPADGVQQGLAAAALLCFGVPLALLLTAAGLTAACAPDHPGLALLGLASIPGLALVGGFGGRRRIESWLAPVGGPTQTSLNKE